MIEAEWVGRTGAPATRDYFAEMYIAGLLADAGWEVFFPRRDKGFDMIATRMADTPAIVRPVQVKGKYATTDKTDKGVYGYSGDLTAVHPDMILAIPYFTSADAVAPCLVAWAPFSALRPRSRGGYRFQPATFSDGRPVMRRHHAQFFGERALRALEDRTYR